MHEHLLSFDDEIAAPWRNISLNLIASSNMDGGIRHLQVLWPIERRNGLTELAG